VQAAGGSTAGVCSSLCSRHHCYGLSTCGRSLTSPISRSVMGENDRTSWRTAYSPNRTLQGSTSSTTHSGHMPPSAAGSSLHKLPAGRGMCALTCGVEHVHLPAAQPSGGGAGGRGPPCQQCWHHSSLQAGIATTQHPWCTVWHGQDMLQQPIPEVQPLSWWLACCKTAAVHLAGHAPWHALELEACELAGCMA
jgi:hypothetical protein